MPEKDKTSLPLVSIIIRSMDRATLSDALDSVTLQTYPNIEIVIVNAKGVNHRKISEWSGKFPLQFVDSIEPLSRSRAANIGLDTASGEYLIFLDDDDWFEAHHVEELVCAIKNHPDLKVVYSGVKCVDRDKNPLPNKFAIPFDSTRLLTENYIPIHAVLFSREILNFGCRMDESLDFYEGWDFCIQVSMFTNFHYTEKISAVYRMTQQSDFGVNADTMDGIAAEKASLILFEKWFHRLKNNQHTKMMSAIRLKRIKDLQLEKQEALINNLNIHLKNKEDALQQMYASTSWRMTRPLRWLGLKNRWIKLHYYKIQESKKHNKGFRNLIGKAFLFVRQQGIKAFKNKLVQYFQADSISPDNTDHSYQEWIRRYDTLTDHSRAVMRMYISKFHHKPLISVVMATYNSKPEWLIEAIESVRSQIYTHWELCIADDASTSKDICLILERYEKKDARIKVVYRTRNGHISAASNSALEMATGEWVVLLDHDDLISEHALFWIANTIQDNPNASLIYSDEDKIDETSKRLNPCFKCDWNVELFNSYNMISHLGAYRTDLLKKIGGFRIGFEGAQDYDLAFRYIEQISADQIHHIPFILYHWRMHAESTAQSTNVKPYAMQAGEKALIEHFQRQKIKAKVTFTGLGYRVHYLLPDFPPMVTLIIPTRNKLHLIRQCVESILDKTQYRNYEILIIDNGSDDPAALQYLHELDANNAQVRVIKDSRPFNYSALNNAAVKLARGEIIGLLNNDVEVISPGWMEEMVGLVLKPQTGAVGARLWYPDNTLQHGGVILGLGGEVAGHSHKYLPRHQEGYFSRANLTQNLSAVTAACLMIRKVIYEEVGGLNEQDLQIAYNDVDFCLRVQELGYRNVWTPYAELYHHESATRGYEDTPEKQVRFSKETNYMKQRWGDLLLNDPAYNPNLTLSQENFSIAWPPRTQFLT